MLRLNGIVPDIYEIEHVHKFLGFLDVSGAY